MEEEKGLELDQLVVTHTGGPHIFAHPIGAALVLSLQGGAPLYTVHLQDGDPTENPLKEEAIKPSFGFTMHPCV